MGGVLTVMVSMRGKLDVSFKHPRSTHLASITYSTRNGDRGYIFDVEGEGDSPSKPQGTDKHARCMLRAFHEHQGSISCLI